MTDSHRRLAAIMFTDMVDYSARAQEDEAEALAVLAEHNRLLRPVFARFSGREVKTVGDAFLVEFESALDATRCALAIQTALHDYNASAEPRRTIRVRIGLHVGDVVRTEGDVLGDAVNIASRIQPLAPPGGICLSQQVFDQVQNKLDTPIVRMPPVALKNIRLPIAVYRVALPWDPGPAVRPAVEAGVGRSLAVLPLANISPDPHDEYFADGLTEELISALSQVRGLSVIARTSVTPYKTAAKPISQVGAELGVDSVLEGSVRKAGNRIRISLQLVDVATQHHIWAANYNREVDDVFAVQTDIADRTAETLRLELAEEARSTPRRTTAVKSAAYDAYLRGLVAAQLPDGRGLEEAFRCFHEATEIDPQFADAFASWANLYVAAAGSHLPMREVMPKARELAARALELDPESSDAHSALANIALQFDHDWPLAEAEFRKAIALNPSNVPAHVFFVLLLISLARFEEAREVCRRVTRLDPGGNHWQTLGWIAMESGEFDLALQYADQECERQPSSLGAHVGRGIYYLSAGRVADARKEAEVQLPEPSYNIRFDHALLNAAVGRPEAGRSLIEKAERGEPEGYTSATDLAMMYAAMGERAKALDLLEQDDREGDQLLWLYYRSVFFDPIREDPRFITMLRRYDLPAGPIRRPVLRGPDRPRQQGQ